MAGATTTAPMNATTMARTTRSPRQAARLRALRHAVRSPATAIGLALVVFLVLLALVADLLPLDPPNTMDVMARRKPPGTEAHLLGTDSFGRDLLSRTVHGARLSLVIALSVVALSSLAGIVLGVVVGYLGGIVDTFVSRIWDVMLSFPGILLFIVIMGTLHPGVEMAILAITIGSIPAFGRLVRERVLAQRGRAYVEAARVIGAGPGRIMFRHVLPNSLTSVLIQSALAVPAIIQAEAALSYLGLGVPPPNPSWGKMIAEGQKVLLTAPWESLVPGAFILLATWGFNLLGDGLRDYLDPTQLR